MERAWSVRDGDNLWLNGGRKGPPCLRAQKPLCALLNAFDLRWGDQHAIEGEKKREKSPHRVCSFGLRVGRPAAGAPLFGVGHGAASERQIRLAEKYRGIAGGPRQLG